MPRDRQGREPGSAGYGGPPSRGSSRGAGAWIRTHREAALGIGAVGAVGLALILKKRKGAGGAASASTPTSTVVPSNSGYSSAASDAYNSLEPQLAALQAQLSALSQPGSGAPPATPPPGNPGAGAVPLPGVTMSPPAAGGYTQGPNTNLVGLSPNEASALGIVPIQVAAAPGAGRGAPGSATNPGITLPPASGQGRFYETPPTGGKSYGFVYG